MKTTSSTTNLIACAVIIGAFTAGFASGPATAQEATPQKAASSDADFQFSFAYEPHELNTAKGAEKLLVRLEDDVRSRCGGYGKMTLDERRHVDACIANTMKSTVPSFGSPTVTQAFADGLRAGG
jgi:UrcA family protein